MLKLCHEEVESEYTNTRSFDDKDYNIIEYKGSRRSGIAIQLSQLPKKFQDFVDRIFADDKSLRASDLKDKLIPFRVFVKQDSKEKVWCSYSEWGFYVYDEYLIFSGEDNSDGMEFPMVRLMIFLEIVNKPETKFPMNIVPYRQGGI